MWKFSFFFCSCVGKEEFIRLLKVCLLDTTGLCIQRHGSGNVTRNSINGVKCE